MPDMVVLETYNNITFLKLRERERERERKKERELLEKRQIDDFQFLGGDGHAEQVINDNKQSNVLIRNKYANYSAALATERPQTWNKGFGIDEFPAEPCSVRRRRLEPIELTVCCKPIRL